MDKERVNELCHPSPSKIRHMQLEENDILTLCGRTFSKRLKELLKEKDITQREFAALLGVTQATMSGYVNGEVPPVSKMIKIANVLGTSIDYLLGGSSVKSPKQVHSVKDIAEYLLLLSEYGNIHMDDNGYVYLGIKNEDLSLFIRRYINTYYQLKSSFENEDVLKMFEDWKKKELDQLRAIEVKKSE